MFESKPTKYRSRQPGGRGAESTRKRKRKNPRKKKDGRLIESRSEKKRKEKKRRKENGEFKIGKIFSRLF